MGNNIFVEDGFHVVELFDQVKAMTLGEKVWCGWEVGWEEWG